MTTRGMCGNGPHPAHRKVRVDGVLNSQVSEGETWVTRKRIDKDGIFSPSILQVMIGDTAGKRTDTQPCNMDRWSRRFRLACGGWGDENHAKELSQMFPLN